VAKLMVTLITASFLMFASTTHANTDSIVEFIPGKIRNVDVMFLPACQGDNHRKICGLNNITQTQTIVKWVGHKNVARFIKLNQLDPKVMSGDTLLPKGYVISRRKPVKI
jgi:hypothetical protein